MYCSVLLDQSVWDYIELLVLIKHDIWPRHLLVCMFLHHNNSDKLGSIRTYLYEVIIRNEDGKIDVTQNDCVFTHLLLLESICPRACLQCVVPVVRGAV